MATLVRDSGGVVYASDAPGDIEEAVTSTGLDAMLGYAADQLALYGEIDDDMWPEIGPIVPFDPGWLGDFSIAALTLLADVPDRVDTVTLPSSYQEWDAFFDLLQDASDDANRIFRRLIGMEA